MSRQPFRLAVGEYNNILRIFSLKKCKKKEHSKPKEGD